MENHARALLILLLLIPPALLGACDSGYSQPQTYVAAKLTLEEQERLTPAAFLKAKSTYRENLIGQWVLEGG